MITMPNPMKREKSPSSSTEPLDLSQLTGLVREVTASDSAIGALYREVLEVTRAHEEAKGRLTEVEQRPPVAGPDEGDLVARAAAWLEETADVAARPDRSRADELRVARFAVETLARLAVEARARWSAAVVAAIQPTYRAQIRAMAEILRQASAATIEHARLIEALHCSGVSGFSSTLRPMAFGGDALRLDRECSTASLWLAEARRFGLLDD